MPMVKRIPQPQEKAGSLCLIYGEPGVGKTASTLLSLPRPILFYELDPRPVERTVGHLVTFENIDIEYPKNFLDVLEAIRDDAERIVNNYRALVLDTFSYLINSILKGDLEEENFASKIFEKKGGARLLNYMGRMTKDDYGSMASLAKRLCRHLGIIARSIPVICTALSEENPNRLGYLRAAPAFAGREFSRDFPGYFDYIGFVESKYIDGKLTFPPQVSFESPDNDFLCKWTGPRDRTVWPLNWKKILNISD